MSVSENGVDCVSAADSGAGFSPGGGTFTVSEKTFGSDSPSPRGTGSGVSPGSFGELFSSLFMDSPLSCLGATDRSQRSDLDLDSCPSRSSVRAEKHTGYSVTINTIRVCASSAFTPAGRSTLFGSAEITERSAFSRRTRSSGFGLARTRTMNGCSPGCSTR